MTLSIMPSPAIHLHTTLAQSMAVVFVCVPNTFSNHFINWPLWSCREDRGGVTSERRLVGGRKFYFWGKCTMPLMTMHSDWTTVAPSGLAI